MKVKLVKKTATKLWPLKGECMRSTDFDTKEPFLFLPCPRCGIMLILGPKTGHTFEVKNGLPTVSASIGCSNCKVHCYVKQGDVEFLKDIG